MLPAATTEPRHRTKHQFVYRTLRDAILRCELPPGERLVIDEMARRFEVSIIPVREALRLLQSEGLVENVAHVGASVAPISKQSIHEVFTVLEGLEVVATRAAAQLATPQDLATLEQIVAEMDGALVAGHYERWADQNRRFHHAITQITAMPLLQQMMERVLDLWDRVRRWSFKGVLVHRVELAQAEHHELLEQLRSRDLDRLEQTIRRHNQGALAAYTAYLDRSANAR